MNMPIRTILAAVLGSVLPLHAASAEAFSPKALQAITRPADKAAFTTGWIPLGLKAADMHEKPLHAGHITDVGAAQMQFHFPSGWNKTDQRPALCIFPGGAYALQAIDKEGTRIAQWAAEHGMVGIVVKYRVSQGNHAVGQFPGPLLDARQAMRIARKYSGALGINPRKIGVIGFSAGGHLAAMTTTLWNRTLPEEAANPLKTVSARPDFSMLIYPVITMTPGTTHGGTRSKILGARSGDRKLVELCSTERQVTAQTPPVFLVQSLDDGVSFKNSQLMEQACTSNHVPVSLNLYPRGGHGYGMEKNGNPTDQWPQAAEQWLVERKILSASARHDAKAPEASGKRES